MDTRNKDRGPLLLIAGGHDHTVPAAITTATRKLYHKSPAITDFREFPDRGHSLTIDHAWREVAQASLDWLQAAPPVAPLLAPATDPATASQRAVHGAGTPARGSTMHVA